MEDVYKGHDAARRFAELIRDGEDNPRLHWRFYPDRDKSMPARNFAGTVAEALPEIERAAKLGFAVSAVINPGGGKNVDIDEVRAFFIDYDADGELPDWHLPPSFTCRRGGKVHAYWLPYEPLAVGEDITARYFREIQKRLARYYGSDPTVCNLSRVMRVPGTEHHKQIAHGPGYELSAPADNAAVPFYTVTQIVEGLPELPQSGRASAAKGGEYDGEPDEPNHVERAFNWLKTRDPAIEGQGGDNWTWLTAANLFEFALSSAKVTGLLNRPYLTAEEKVTATGQPKSWNDRCAPPWDLSELETKVENALEHGENPWGCRITGQKAEVKRVDASAGLAPCASGDGGDVPEDVSDEASNGSGSDWFQPVIALNQRYAVVTAGSLAGNIADLVDPRSPVMLSKNKLCLILQRQKAEVPPQKEGDTATKAQIAPLWLNWAGRREITGLEFRPPGSAAPDPLKHNLWQGYAVEPKEGTEHEGFLGHLKDNVCDGDPDLYCWLINWLADLVQYPGRKRAVAVTLHSEDPGTGKSVVFEWCNTRS